MPTSPTTDHIIYLHGWGEDPVESELAKAIDFHLPGARIHFFGYHPGGDCQETRVPAALHELSSLVNAAGTSPAVRMIGYSFGGLLAALFAQQHSKRIAKLLLFAPAIDNIARNYSGEPAAWRMPEEYVAELRSYPVRPAIVCPTTLVYGALDDDAGGSTPQRYRAWASEQHFTAVHELPGVDHDLEPWLTRNEPQPSLAELLADWRA